MPTNSAVDKHHELENVKDLIKDLKKDVEDLIDSNKI